jgi:hypothetical protein
MVRQTLGDVTHPRERERLERQRRVAAVWDAGKDLLRQDTPNSWSLSSLRCELRRAVRDGLVPRNEALAETLAMATAALRRGDELKCKSVIIRHIQRVAPELLS